ncbi:hypothetical protein AGMMS49571_11280 [Endomicrobiia bacterium]|nr:hypothetical protein AGMMS49571_11280 [Endomicrobiia bacterium]
MPLWNNGVHADPSTADTGTGIAMPENGGNRSLIPEPVRE